MNDHMKEARVLAAQCWCDEETSGTEMNAVLAEAVARRIAAWMDTAAQMARNADYYRDLLDECAKLLGVAAYTSNDGTVQDEPLRLKVPELVAALQKQLAAAKEDAECAWRNTRAAEAEAAKLRGLLIACRGSVKTDLNAYERLLVAKQKHGEQETPTYTAADAETQRLFALLAEIDALALATPNA